jgi:translation elongation factor EF-G
MNNWHLIEAVIEQARETYTGGDLIKLREKLKDLEEGDHG